MVANYIARSCRLDRVLTGRLSKRDGDASLMVPILPIKFVHPLTLLPSWSQSVQPEGQNFHLYCIIFQKLANGLPWQVVYETINPSDLVAA